MGNDSHKGLEIPWDTHLTLSPMSDHITQVSCTKSCTFHCTGPHCA